MKRLIATVTVLALLVSMIPSAFAAEPSSENRVQQNNVAVGDQDLSGECYSDIFGDGGAYQIVSITPTKEDVCFVVGYIAETATELTITAVDEDTGKIFLNKTLPVSAGQGTITIDADINAFPDYYQVDASLAEDDTVFTYYDHTHAYQEFLGMQPDDSSFAGQEIIDYGEGFDNTDNFAVVRKDVKVLHVDSMEDVGIVGGNGEQAALFSLMDGAENQEYVFDKSTDCDMLSELATGDKLLILPSDDVNDAKTIIVDNVQDNVSLFSDGEEVETVTITPSSEEPDLEDFFDYVRIHVQIKADTDDLDTSDADPDVIEEDTVELLGSIGARRSAFKSFTLSKNISHINIKDTFSVAVIASLSINYSGLSLKSVTATATISARNEFTIICKDTVSCSKEWYVGTIPAGTVSGVTFSIPVYITFYANFGGELKYSTTQTATATVTATYSGGRYYCTTSKDANAGSKLSASASATVRLGVKPTIQAKPCIVNLSAAVTGEVGIQVSGKYKNRALSGDISIYIQPSFTISWRKKTLFNKTWGITTKRIASISSKAAYFGMPTLAEMTDQSIEDYIELYKEDGMVVLIDSAESLRQLAEYVNSGKPTAGIDFVVNMSEKTIDISDSLWIPIGTIAHPFRGTFDGRGRTITGLNIDSGYDDIGLFGRVSHASVHDIALTESTISGGSYVGGIVGYASDNSQIFDVSVSGTVSGSGGCIGGLAGYLNESSLLNSYSTADVGGEGEVGGIVGGLCYTEKFGQIANCYSTGSIDCQEEYGGICGSIIVDSSGQEEHEAGIWYPMTGVTYCYCLAAEGLSVVGTVPDGAEVMAWTITEAQVAGTGNSTIANEGYAAENSLLDALNNWYLAYGAYSLENMTPVDDSLANVSDYCNRWYQDEGGYPFNEGGTIEFPLTVHYVYEDGSEAHQTTTIYYRLGEHFDVDPQKITGFHTNVDDENGFQGYMCPDPTKQTFTLSGEDSEDFTGIEYTIIYTKDVDYAGNGADLSASDPAASGSIYRIDSEADLVSLSAYAADGGNTAGVTFEQTADINLSEDLMPIGNASHPFQGTYQGDYRAITGLTAPLFGEAKDAVLLDIKMNSNISSAVGSVGALVGRAWNTSVSGCDVEAVINVTANDTGGLLGCAENCVINNSRITGSVQGCAVTGGCAGSMTNGRILNCAVIPAVIGGGKTGGILGESNGAAVENCYVAGNVSGESNVGGLIGSFDSGSIRNCYTSGAVTGSEKTGAVFGTISESTEVDSVYYVSDSTTNEVGQGKATGIRAFSTTEFNELCDSLNAWVAKTTSGTYLTWMADLMAEPLDAGEIDPAEKTGLPVFGEPYHNWLMDFTLSDGKVSFCLDREQLGDGAYYLAVYSACGQMLDVRKITGDGSQSVDVSDDASYAKCFAFDEDGQPLGVEVHSVNSGL